MKIKVILEKGETRLDADNALLKALQLHTNGDAHKEKFEDPAMENLENKLSELHKLMLNDLIQKIFDELDKEDIV